MCQLRRAPDRQEIAFGVVARENAAGLYRMRATAMLFQVDGQTMRRSLDGCIGIAVTLNEIDQ